MDHSFAVRRLVDRLEYHFDQFPPSKIALTKGHLSIRRSETTRSLKSILNLAVIPWSNSPGKDVPLLMPHRKLVRILNYVFLLVVFPIAMAFLFGVLAHSTSFGIKTFLLIECGMAVLSPLLNAVIGDDDHSHHKRGK
jgi:hypothetical protein